MFFNPIFMIFGVVFGIISLFAVLIGLLVLSIILWLRKLFSPLKIDHDQEIQNDNDQDSQNLNPGVEINSNQDIIPDEEIKEEHNEGQAANQNGGQDVGANIPPVEDQNDWPICYELLDRNHRDLATVLWGHVFHMNCIEDWIGNDQNNLCPMDRRRILRHEIIRLIF